MPLSKGSSRAVIATNIREMKAAGHPQRQAVAAALREADQSKRSKSSAHSSRGLAMKKKGPMIQKPHEGRLHKRLGVPEGKKIPREKIEHDKARAEREHDTAAIKQDVFAENFGHGTHTEHAHGGHHDAAHHDGHSHVAHHEGGHGAGVKALIAEHRGHGH